MLSRNLGLAIVLVAASASAGPQKYYFTRKFIVGHVDQYVLTNTVSSPMSMTMTMHMSQKVTKVYPNGDADVQSTMSEMKMLMNGKAFPDTGGGAAQKGQTITIRVNKFGSPVAAKGAPAGMMGMDMGLGTGVNGLEKGLVMGKAVPFNVPSKNGAGPAIKGSIRLASVKNGIAIISQTFDMSMSQAGTTMHGTGTVRLRVKDGTMLSTSMKMTGTTMGGPSEMHMTVKHL